MTIKKHIPNAITLLNMFCGCLAVLFAVNGNLDMAFYFVILGIVFDYFDGFAARILNVKSELGLQLDSLADMVTSGVVPGAVMFILMFRGENLDLHPGNFNDYWPICIKGIICYESTLFPFLGLLITLASGYRLAKFNIDTRQTDSFIGLPTPANTLLILSLPMILMTTDIEWIKDLITNKWFLLSITGVSCILLNAELPLFALKFKTFGIKENAVKYLFILGSGVALVMLHYLAIPIIILSYVVLSLILNLRKE